MQPEKQRSLLDLSMIVVSLVIGMGIFHTPVNVASGAQIPELFFLAWIIGGLFFLRKRTAHLNKKDIYSMSLYPLMPLVFIAAYLFVAISIYNDDPMAAINGLLIFAGFIIIYFINRLLRKNKA